MGALVAAGRSRPDEVVDLLVRSDRESADYFDGETWVLDGGSVWIDAQSLGPDGEDERQLHPLEAAVHSLKAGVAQPGKLRAQVGETIRWVVFFAPDRATEAFVLLCRR